MSGLVVTTNVGRTITSNDGKHGIIIHETQRYCRICRKTHACYVIQWDDGSKTWPCEKAVGEEDRCLILK